jgi:hypothetical protein
MPVYHKGDVVIVRFPFSENPSQDKIRPGIILADCSLSPAEKYPVCKITSVKPNSAYHPHYREVSINSVEGREMGLRQDSFIVCDAIELLESFLILKKIGFYRRVNEIYSIYYLGNIAKFKKKLRGDK